MTPSEKKIHRLRRHRRGKRGGKKHRPTEPLTLAPNPVAVQSLRARLAQLATQRSA